MSRQVTRQIASNLRALRKERHLTQTELGHLIGRDGFQISRWERSANRPTDAALLALAEALGVDYIAFFYEPEKQAA